MVCEVRRFGGRLGYEIAGREIQEEDFSPGDIILMNDLEQR